MTRGEKKIPAGMSPSHERHPQPCGRDHFARVNDHLNKHCCQEDGRKTAVLFCVFICVSEAAAIPCRLLSARDRRWIPASLPGSRDQYTYSYSTVAGGLEVIS